MAGDPVTFDATLGDQYTNRQIRADIERNDMARGDQHIRLAFEADHKRDYLTVVEECKTGLKKGVKLYNKALVYARLGNAYSQLERF